MSAQSEGHSRTSWHVGNGVVFSDSLDEYEDDEESSGGMSLFSGLVSAMSGTAFVWSTVLHGVVLNNVLLGVVANDVLDG